MENNNISLQDFTESATKMYIKKEALVLFKHNRDIQERTLTPLIKSMEKEGWRQTEPIIIGWYQKEGVWIIIDGQHRYTAQQTLLKGGVNISYTCVVEDLTDMTDTQIGKRIIEYNTQKKTWGKLDYLKLYCSLQYNDYIKLNILFAKYGNIKMLLDLFKYAYIQNTITSFEQGFFKYVEKKEDMIIDILCLVAELHKKRIHSNVYMLSALYTCLEQTNTFINKDKYYDHIHKLNMIDNEKELVHELNKLFKV